VASLKREIAQKRPFSSAEEEAMLNLLRTADYFEHALQQRTRAWGVTSTQYNVLRILRGAGGEGSENEGLTCTAIGERMITAEPDITRLLGRLKVLKLIRQRRDKRDRRVVRTQIAEAGLELLAKMDAEIQSAPREMLAHMSAAEIAELIRLLEKARHSEDETQPVSCEGNRSRES
jgi:DNA-binding MarR family transcriptional regulator